MSVQRRASIFQVCKIFISRSTHLLPPPPQNCVTSSMDDPKYVQSNQTYLLILHRFFSFLFFFSLLFFSFFSLFFLFFLLFLFFFLFFFPFFVFAGFFGSFVLKFKFSRLGFQLPSLKILQKKLRRLTRMTSSDKYDVIRQGNTAIRNVPTPPIKFRFDLVLMYFQGPTLSNLPM